MGRHDALNASIQPSIDLVGLRVRDPGRDAHAVGVGCAHNQVHFDRAEGAMLAVQVNGVKSCNGGVFNQFRSGER